MTSEEAPKSYDREGGQRVKLARYARWFGVFLLCLTVASWTALQQRPAIPDAQVADAVAWAENAPRIPCERPGLDGELANGCTTERRDDAWLERRAREIRDGAGHTVLVEAFLQVEDRLRGPQPRRPLDSRPLALAGYATTQRGEPVDLAVLERARTVVAPTARDYLLASAAAFIEGPLERGRVESRSHPHARAEVVALARIARRAEPCDSFDCVLAALEVAPVDPTPKWHTLLVGPRAAAPERIAETEVHWRDTYRRELETLQRHQIFRRGFIGSD